MTSARPTIDTILNDAVEIAQPEQRAAYLDRACAGDALLRQQAGKLIADHFRAGQFLEQPAAAGLAATEAGAISERPGMMIGPYKLLEQIGEGGFGVVFMAEQQQPVRRKVALKVLKPGMDTRQVIARFEAERQALALMDHPNIARVLDAGETSSARPYFVMELVKGIPLTQFCDEGQLTARERLELFVSVCQAVQHAHHKGIIHRDLKPSNILVTLHDGTPVVKVIDFGVAKATGYQLTEKTLFTGFAQMIGTPLYMSPEQAALSGLDIDTRSDIYSLGVLLYELLTGTTPLTLDRLKKAAFDEIRRLIREDEPQKPSTRVQTLGETATTISAHRKTEPHKLRQLLRNELDWIVMKALEKDRTRRYDTATGLAKDVQRYLADEPVEACPPSVYYRLSKVYRKHRASISTAVMVAVLMLIATAASAWQAYRAAFAEQRAVINSQISQQERQRADGKAAEALAAKRLADEKTAEALAAQKSLRQSLYASDMNLVQAAFQGKQFRQAADLLARQPADLRGFEWHYWQRQLNASLVRSLPIRRLQDVPETARGGALSTAVRFTAGGTQLAGIAVREAGPDAVEWGTVVWNTATASEQSPFQSLPAPVNLSGRGTRAGGSASDAGTVFPRGPYLYSGIGFDVSGDGARVAFATRNLMLIRDTRTRETVATRQQFPGPQQLAFSPDGTRLAVVIASVTGSTTDRGPPGAVSFFPNGPRARTRLALLNLPEVQRELDVTAEQLERIGSLRGTLPSLRPAGLPPAVARPSGALEILDAATGRVLHEFPITRRDGLSLGSTQVLWSPDGRRLLRQIEYRQPLAPDPIGRQYSWQLIDSESGESLWNRDFPQGTIVSARTWSPDGKHLVVTELASPRLPSLQLWDAATGETLAAIDRSAPLLISAPNVAFSPDGRLLAAVNMLDEVEIWKVSRDEADVRLTPDRSLNLSGERIDTVAFSADSRSLHGVTDSRLVTWDLTSPLVASLGPAGSEFYESVTFSPDSSRVALGSSGPGLQSIFGGVFTRAYVSTIWDLARDRELRRIEPPHYGPLVFTADGRHILAVRQVRPPSGGFPTQALVVISAASGQEERSIPLETLPFSICADATGQQVAALFIPQRPLPSEPHTTGQVVVWSLESTAPPRTIACDAPAPHLLGFAGGGRSVMVGYGSDLEPGAATGLLTYDIASGKLLSNLKLPGDPWHVNQQRGLILAGRKDLQLCELKTGAVVHRLPGQGFPLRFAYSPDGHRLAVSYDPGSGVSQCEIALWSLDSGRRLLTLEHRGTAQGLAFSATGDQLLLVASDRLSIERGQPVRVFDATPLKQP